MRITSGIAKGHRLRVPVVPDLRPAKSMVRQAIFSVLRTINDTFVLDLFAGSGSLGLEALSRNARWTDFVDINDEACKAIQENLKHARFKGKAKIHHESAEVFLLSCPPHQYDLILADPPYELNIDHIWAKLPPILKNGGVVVYLHHKDTHPPSKIKGLEYKETRHYGETGVTFLTKG